MTSLRRYAALTLLLLVPLLGACGFNVQTDQDYQPADGVSDRSASVDVLNALIVSAENGSGTFIATLVNNLNEPNALTEVSGTDLSGSQVTIPVPASGLVDLATDGLVRLSGAQIVPGYFVSVRLGFQSGETVNLKVPVFPHSGDYAKVPVGADEPEVLPDEQSSND